MRLKNLIFAPAALSLAIAANVNAAPASVQLPDFMYQGKLDQNDNPANGNYDLTFSLWDAATGGNRIGNVISEPGYPVQHGLFSINLAFAGAFVGDQTWLEVSVNGTVLPRQAIATAPVAQFALSGNVGPIGPQGPQGTAGATGAQGSQGADGPTGATGPQGLVGPTGAQGPVGADGATGPAGEIGATGAQGAAGPTGATGAQGGIGPVGEMGPQGATGAQGAAGPTGATGAQGGIGPTGELGPQGATGAQGVAGPTGAPGAQGPIGATGAQGVTGPAGDTGAQGPTGAVGATGAAGATGPSGATGAQGATGAAGSGKYRVSINGTLSTALARPLHPVSAGGYAEPVSLISAQGYVISILSGGYVAGQTTAYYASNNCTGPAFVFATGLVHPGGLIAMGNARTLYYVPKAGATVVNNPTRNSRSTTSIPCEASTAELVGGHYVAPVNVPATTGVDTLVVPAALSIDYVP